ncbi:carbon catabolite repressor protein 4 homolog 5 isoform X2 [Beta vulgaris subsp. vulgaris]|uniref:carbon catabolite repressor protein 4 homolog 5 isoform X2 n=1 Tax=Beta vulgaris subsp. vulgaris TaxID=3555 RepID=UPI002548C246|nr:carbon catabolite repressor protein 4 homolog 5 isoform X2 [Beta vulgaris subsp. vulgaris]
MSAVRWPCPLTLFHSTKLNNVHCASQPALKLDMESHYSKISKHSHRIKKKRKIVYEEEQKALTLEQCNVSSSKQFKSTSYQRHTNHRTKRDSNSSHFYRKWSYSDCDSSAFRDKLVLVSYNILAVENASKHPHLYLEVPFKYMEWDHRRAAICKELTQYDPSILCFQAIDRFSDLHDALQQDGFKGVLKARTGDAQDGCAIFWKDERFKLLHEENIEFQSFGLRNNVAQFCVLKMNDDQLNSDPALSMSTSLVVGNIHVLFNPNRGDIKLGQIRLFLEKAHRLSEEWGGIPVVLAGDYNSVPQLDILQHDRKRICGQIETPLRHNSLFKQPFRQKRLQYGWNDEELKLAAGSEKVTCLQHSLKLHSAYLGVPGNIVTRDDVGEPWATSCHSKFLGTVDYIWHSEHLIPVRVLETLPRNALENIGGLPSKNWGSDHLALVCEFAVANFKTPV